ncbi:MAG: glycosyltransferase, partial [Blastocatellia bacterium]|nr:glycosyltransferase [Blastocatellia bacterium]
LTIFRIHNAIDPNIFQYSSEKKKQIAFSTNKNYDDLVQVINILKFRGTIADYQLVPISAKSEKEVAEILKESSIFLSFVNGEGFGLLAAEAMSCGCIVVGYDGMGGKEFFNTSFCYPVQQPDVINFAKNVEKVISAYEKNPDLIRAQAKKASVFINSTYSLQKEESDIVAVWTKLLNQ